MRLRMPGSMRHGIEVSLPGHRKEKRMAKKLTKTKAREILSHGEVHGKPLTKKQRGFMGARAQGAPMKKGGRKKH